MMSTARDEAERLIRDHYHAGDFCDRIEAAITAAERRGLEDAAKVADKDRWHCIAKADSVPLGSARVDMWQACAATALKIATAIRALAGE
jgi:hypothetical protein